MKRQSNRIPSRGNSVHRTEKGRRARFELESLELRRLLSASYDLSQTILSPDGQTGDQFGTVVATQGNLALIGAPAHTSDGEAYLVDTSSGQVLHTFTDPAPVDGDMFGSGAMFVGNKIAIERFDGHLPSGDSTIDVYDLTDLNAAPLIIHTSPGNLAAGGSHTMATDGTDLFVGIVAAPDFVVGSVERFDINTGALLQTYTDPAASHQMGANIAIHGNTLYASGFDNSIPTDIQGVVAEFNIPTGQVLDTLYAPAPYNTTDQNTFFGGALTVAPNGDLFVSNYEDFATGGDVFQFAPDNSLIRVYTSPDFATDINAGSEEFGQSLATNDQNQLIVGSGAGHFDDPTNPTAVVIGAAYVYDYTDGSLVTSIQPDPIPLATFGNVAVNGFGYRVADLPNGQLMITGPSLDTVNNAYVTAAYVYTPHVENAAPTVQIDQAPTDPVYPSQPITVTFTGDDANAGDTLTAIVDWGDGATTAVADARGTISVGHAYSLAGDHTVQITISDQANATASANTTLTVLTPTAALDDLMGDVQSMDLSNGVTNSLTSKLQAADHLLGQDVGNDTSINALLTAFNNGVDHWYAQGKLTLDQHDQLISESQWIQESVTT